MQCHVDEGLLGNPSQNQPPMHPQLSNPTANPENRFGMENWLQAVGSMVQSKVVSEAC